VAKRVRVSLHGVSNNRGILMDADATDGARIGENLRWSDGTLVTETQVRNPSGGGTTNTSSVSPTLWSLILNIPAIIKSLIALTTDGWIRNDGGTLSSSHWPWVKNSVETGEAFTIPSGNQLLVYDEFLFDGGELIIDGELVIL